MTIQEASKRLAKSEKTVRRWIEQGKLNATLVDGKYIVDDNDVMSKTTTDQVSSQMSNNVQDELITELRSEIEYLKKLLDESQQARERADTIMLSQSRQLEQKAIEAPKRATWLRRVFRKPT